MCPKASSTPRGRGIRFTLRALAEKITFHKAALAMGSVLSQPVSPPVSRDNCVLAHYGAALTELEFLRTAGRE